MPCFSRFQTRLTESDRIADAILGLGGSIDEASTTLVTGRVNGQRVEFSRYSERDAFTTGSSSSLTAIGRKYAELGVTRWAKRKGYSVVANDGEHIHIKNRRS